ncbi:MAG TPA: zinc-ribbon domain-containing protein [Solirubrobacterales bacterium]|nr:zinc-ribbon domain-containing protein [Solirubrobacterales bacterium]
MTPPGGAGEAGGERYCGNCGERLSPGAAFCRSCGARYVPPAAAPSPGAHPEAGEDRPGSRAALWLALAIVVVGAGAALAILLSSGGSSSSTTVVVDSEGSTATETTTAEESTVAERATGSVVGSVEAGRYVQAGSFKTDIYAEVERDRLVAAGIDVEVVESDEVGELYPGFRVLLAGPVESDAEEKGVIKALDRNGVSAFARPVTPAREIDSSEAAGEWSGVLERSSSERPRLDDSLDVTLEMDSEGRTGTLEVPATGCSQTLTLAQEREATLTYLQDHPCVSDGPMRIRPAEGQLMVTVLPIGPDTLVLGSLTPR